VPSEFELIARYFTRATSHTLLGVGDDGALDSTPTPGQELVISTDLLVEGTHFLADTDPEDLGWKTLRRECFRHRRDGRAGHAGPPWPPYSWRRS
jgi:thiamine-monophosphate kinase